MLKAASLSPSLSRVVSLWPLATFRGGTMTCRFLKVPSMSVDLLLPAGEKITLVLEGIGDDKVRLNSMSLDQPLTILPDQALEIVAIAKITTVSRRKNAARAARVLPAGRYARPEISQSGVEVHARGRVRSHQRQACDSATQCRRSAKRQWRSEMRRDAHRSAMVIFQSLWNRQKARSTDKLTAGLKIRNPRIYCISCSGTQIVLGTLREVCTAGKSAGRFLTVTTVRFADFPAGA
jgi:hypothetical protein